MAQALSTNRLTPVFEFRICNSEPLRRISSRLADDGNMSILYSLGQTILRTAEIHIYGPNPPPSFPPPGLRMSTTSELYIDCARMLFTRPVCKQMGYLKSTSDKRQSVK